MRVVFAGSGDFAVPSLRALDQAGHSVVLVLTAPDRLGSRGRPARRPVRDLALELGAPLAKPDRLTVDSLGGISLDSAELLIVCDYGQLLPTSVLQLFQRGAVGVHPSLLPKLRGASPISGAILEGLRETGVTIYQMDSRMDAGPILAQRVQPVSSNVTAPSLSDQLAQLAAGLLIETMANLAELQEQAPAQDEADATFTTKVAKEDGEISWELGAETIDRKVRALQPWPGTVASIAGARVKLLAGRPGELSQGLTAQPPGTILAVSAGSALVATGDGAYELDLLQPPGGTPMAPAAYLRGRRLVPAGQC